MMKDHLATAPADVVIGVSTALLAAVLGLGAAFALWMQLHHTADPRVLTGSVVALGAGLGLLGLALRPPRARLFLVVAGVSLVVAFFSAPGVLANLVS